MTDLTEKPPVGASAWELDLWKHLTGHIRAERAMLEEYQAAADATGSKALQYLVGLLIDDEIRHHKIFQELAESLRTCAELGQGEPVIPAMDFHQADKREVLDITDRLLDSERMDAAELKRLRKELHDVKDTTLWGVLVEQMQRDTDKHIALLRFVKRHAGSRRF